MGANGALTLRTLYGGKLAPVDKVIQLLAKETDVERADDFDRMVDAARKIDANNSERSAYWNEIALYSFHRLGELLKENQRQKGRPKKADKVSALSDKAEIRERRARQFAESIAKDKLSEYAARQKESQDEITKSGAVRFATQQSTNSKSDLSWSLYDGLEAVNKSLRRILEHWPEEHIDTLAAKLISVGEEIRDTGGLA